MSEPEAERAEALSDQFDPYLGKTLSGFRVDRLIGEGGMGRVYEAMQISLKRPVALKILASNLVKQNPAFSERFLREATTAAQIAHPNIVQVYDAGESQGVYYIAMELVQGCAVDQVIRKEGILPLRKAVDIILQSARGLAAAQKKKLVHRDIKPSNLMVTEDDIVKVADFGLAKNTEGTAVLTNTGQILGTPAFMSPEQGKGRPADHRSDQYSLGVTFFVLVTGTLPYKGESSVSIIYQHISDPVPDPCLRNPTLPREVAEVVRRMMAKKPAQRFETFLAVIDALEALERKGLFGGAVGPGIGGGADMDSGEATLLVDDPASTPLTAAVPPAEAEAPEAGAPHVDEDPTPVAADDAMVVEDYTSMDGEGLETEYWQTEGDLHARDIGFVLKEIARARQTGILTVSTARKSTSLYVDGDEVSLYAVDGKNAIRIGDILLRHHHLTEEELGEALEKQEQARQVGQDKVLLGDLLVELGHVSAEERDAAMTMQMEEEFFELFTLREGHYKFIKQRLSKEEFEKRYRTQHNAFSIADVIRDARQRVNEWKRVIHDLRDDKEILVLRKDLSERLADIEDPLERKVLERLTGENNLADIVDQLLVPKFKVFKIVGKYLEMDKIYRPSLEDLKNGAAYMRSEMKYPVAAKLLERAFNLQPGDTTIVQSLAQTYEELLDPKRAAAYYKILARQHFEQGREADGLGLCEKIVRLYPADAYAFDRLFDYNVRHGNIPAALEMGRGLLRVHLSEGSSAKAREVAGFILQHAPDDVGTLRKLVNLHLEAGEIPLAIQGYETILSLLEKDPSMPESQRSSERAQVWEKILRLDPGRGDIRKKLEALAKEKEPRKSRFTYPVKLALGIVALLLVLAAVGAYYELSARSLFEKVDERARALEAKGQYIEAITEYGKVISSYSLSTVTDRAKERRAELKAREERRQRELAKIKEELSGKITAAYELLEKGDADGARSIFETIKLLDVPPALKIEANRGLARIEALRRERAEQRFSRYVDMARAAIDDARVLEKEKKLPNLLQAREKYREALEHLGRVRGEFSETWRNTVESVTAGVQRDLAAVENLMQATYLAEAEAAWSDAEVPAETALEAAVNALSIEGTEENRAEAKKLRADIEGYIAEARALHDKAFAAYRAVEDRPPEERREALRGILDAVKTLLQEYPRTETARKARFPLLVVTEPGGAALEGERLEVRGPTPSLVLYPPYEVVRVSLSKPGYRPVSFRTDAGRVLVTRVLEKTHLRRWKGAGAVEGSPVPDGGWLYFADRSGFVRAWKASPGPETPVERWEPFAAQGDVGGIKTSLTVRDGRAYFCTATLGLVYALDLSSGQPLWTEPYRAGRMVDHRPVTNGSLVVVAHVGGTVCAVDADTGREAWRKTLPPRGEVRVSTRPVFGEKGRFVYVPYSKGVARLSAEDGSVAWFKSVATIQDIHVALSGEILLLTSGETLLAFAVDGEGVPGAPLWSKEGRACLTPPVAWKGRVYVGDENGQLRAFAAADGSLLGSYDGSESFSFSLPPLVMDGRAVLVSRGKVLASFDTSRSEYALRWTYGLDEGTFLSPPAVSGGYLYAATSEGSLRILEND